MGSISFLIIQHYIIKSCEMNSITLIINKLLLSYLDSLSVSFYSLHQVNSWVIDRRERWRRPEVDIDAIARVKNVVVLYKKKSKAACVRCLYRLPTKLRIRFESNGYRYSRDIYRYFSIWRLEIFF